MKELTSMQEFDELLAGDGLVVVDFKADWCGPCKMIAPKLEGLAQELKARPVTFVKVDVDTLADVSRRAGISAMPTFHLYKKGALVEEIVGADYPKLAAAVRRELASMKMPATAAPTAPSVAAAVRNTTGSPAAAAAATAGGAAQTGSNTGRLG
jgi:thioredoxin 1